MLKFASLLIFSGLLATAILSPYISKTQKPDHDGEARALSNNQATIAQDVKASLAQMRAGHDLPPPLGEGASSRRAGLVTDVELLKEGVQEAAMPQPRQALPFKPATAASLLQTSAEVAPKAVGQVKATTRRFVVVPISSTE